MMRKEFGVGTAVLRDFVAEGGGRGGWEVRVGVAAGVAGVAVCWLVVGEEGEEGVFEEGGWRVGSVRRGGAGGGYGCSVIVDVGSWHRAATVREMVRERKREG